MKRKHAYPGTDNLAPVTTKGKQEDSSTAPDILETAGGFCPNYDKFEARGMSPEKALVWCNMD